MRSPWSKEELLVHRTTVILQALAAAAEDRDLQLQTGDVYTALEEDSQNIGPPSAKRPFVFPDPSYQPVGADIEPSPEVLARWEAHLAVYPDDIHQHIPVLRQKRPLSPVPEPVELQQPDLSSSAARRERKKRTTMRMRKSAASAPLAHPGLSPLSAPSSASSSTASSRAAPPAHSVPSASSAPLGAAAPACSVSSLSSSPHSAPPACPAPSATSALSSAPSPSTPLPSAPPARSVSFTLGPAPPVPAEAIHARGRGNRKAKRVKEDVEWRASHSGVAFDSNALPLRLAAKHLHCAQSTRADQLAHADLATNKSTYIGPPPISKVKVAYLQDYHWPDERMDDLPPSVQKYLDQGFCIIKNDPTKAQVIEDANGVILVLKARPPPSKFWQLIVDSVEEQITKLDAALTHHAYDPEKGTQRTDGTFKHATFGVSMGGGQKEPKYLNVRNEWHDAIRAFIDHPDVRIYAQHMSEIFRFWFPKLFALYQELECQLNEKYPDMYGAFPGFPMMSETPNTSNRVRTPEHVDFKNAIFGMCVIAVFGSFDHKKSGMLVLRELKILLPLAPGDIVFIPSALITHGNTELAQHDIRRSWTLFTAGGLFRYRDFGFATQKDLRERGELDRLQRLRQVESILLQERLAMHMSLEQLREYHNVPLP